MSDLSGVMYGLVESSRPVYLGLSSAEYLFWIALVVLAIVAGLWGVYDLGRKYLRGRKAGLPNDLTGRVWRGAAVLFSHAWIRRRDPLAGIAHLGIFYGFLGLFIGTSLLFLQVDIIGPLFGWVFWQGRFYQIYSLVMDLSGVTLLTGLLYMAYRRAVLRPRKLDYARHDRTAGYDRTRYMVGDWIFLGTLIFLVISGFLLEGLRIAATHHPSHEQWSIVGWWLASSLTLQGGLDSASAEVLRHRLWWTHGLVALSFVASIPYTKAMHMLVAPVSVAARDAQAGRQLDEVPDEAAEGSIGYSSVLTFSPKHLLSLDACTKCGKCHEACPANASGFPLSPRDLILDLRELSSASFGGISGTLSLEPPRDASRPVLGAPIRTETLWSCMQCMACTEICPVGIEHVPMINQMRRALIDAGDLDPMLQSTLERVHNSGNSFGEPKRKRASWTKELPQPVKDARKEAVEFLWFVGDYASFDPRNQQVTRTLARVLQAAGVDFGILFDGEKTAGNDVRRAGEEGLWRALAEENIRTIGKCSIQKIVTSDPHSFNTIRNEYPRLGAPWKADSVVHHSQLLLRLIQSGAIQLKRKLDYRATYHDPCHLGRYNGVYDAPRSLLHALGVTLVEMPRNRDNSFCCGAGGGRIWMKDLRDENVPRPSESRIDEAVGLGTIDLFVVACPKDVTMYEDAIKTSGHQQHLKLRELSELVAEAMEL
ncbi:MAG: heterodisulfide reductase-related iron-sulfur binding cluster [Dehalococcoidia bacterium]